MPSFISQKKSHMSTCQHLTVLVILTLNKLVTVCRRVDHPRQPEKTCALLSISLRLCFYRVSLSLCLPSPLSPCYRAPCTIYCWLVMSGPLETSPKGKKCGFLHSLHRSAPSWLLPSAVAPTSNHLFLTPQPSLEITYFQRPLT